MWGIDGSTVLEEDIDINLDIPVLALIEDINDVLLDKMEVVDEESDALPNVGSKDVVLGMDVGSVVLLVDIVGKPVTVSTLR